jgi:hypothetical protein
MATPVQQTPVTTNAQVATSASTTTDILPGAATLLQAAKIAIEQDRCILLDYYVDTAKGTAFLGEDKVSKERILVKSKDEFTSLIRKLYKVGDDFIILTENSLYIVSGKIQKRGINLASLHEAAE